MLYNPSAYVREAGGPGELQKHVADIQQSGLVTVILGMLHIGDPDKGMQLGDFIYNNYPAGVFVAGGTFNPQGNKDMADWPAQVARLKQGESVSTVLLSIGSPPEYWTDFGNIGKMFAEGKAELLKQNLMAVKEAFTIDGRCAIDGFDIDCEEDLDQSTQDIVVKFCTMVFGLGFQVTFCPFDDESWWQGCMKALWDQGHYVSGWNLQCYAGGKDNRKRLADWLAALATVVGKEKAPYYLMPGLAVASAMDTNPKSDRFCPSQVEATVAGWKNRELGGIFLWRYDALTAEYAGMCGKTNTLSHYIAAIKRGMNNA